MGPSPAFSGIAYNCDDSDQMSVGQVRQPLLQSFTLCISVAVLTKKPVYLGPFPGVLAGVCDLSRRLRRPRVYPCADRLQRDVLDPRALYCSARSDPLPK